MNQLMVAAGHSRRFGLANKLLARIAGRPLIVICLSRLLAASHGPVVLVLGHQSPRVIAALARHGLAHHPRLRIVINRRARSGGMAGSLDKALAAAARLDSAVTIHLADMPLSDARADQRLARAIRVGYPVARVHHAGRPGHPVRVHRKALIGQTKPGRLPRAVATHREATAWLAVPARLLRDIDSRQMIRSLI